MMTARLLVSLFLLSCALGVCAKYHIKLVKESRSQSIDWVKGKRADGNERLQLHLFVKQEGLEALERTLIAVSDPRSKQYGRHLTLDQVNRLVAPADETVVAILAWLKHHGVDTEKQLTATDNFDIITIDTTVSMAEKLLSTTYHHFHSSRMHLIRAFKSYSLPTEVHHLIDFVGPTIRFPTVRRHRLKKLSSSAAAAAPNDGVTPTFLRQLYNVGTYTAQSKNSSQAIASFLEQYMDQADLNSFFTSFSPGTGGQQPVIVGPNDPTNPGVEAMLDIEYIMSVGANIPTQFWYTAGRQPNSTDNEPFLVWLQTLASTPVVPSVFSISYGDNENTVNFDYATRVNVEFQKAGVRGISLMAASGDGGVGGSQPSACTTFIPTYPGDSPYITAVGGSTSSSPEVAASLSGGGFSNYFARPSWQTSAVSQYFQVAQNLPDPSVYNQTGIGFPDVAAQAQGFNIVVSGSTFAVDGTSCATPTFSAIVGLLNDVRFAAGKSPLGFLNILFYQHPEVFNDITSGSNPGCGTNGFSAAQGWDPVTGLGTPDFQKLSALVKSLP